MEVATLEQQRAGFAKGTSGNPKGRAAIRERAAELYAIMAPDFGELSATDQVLLNQACLLLARSERVHRVRDIDVGVRMSGEARRLLQALRRRAPACSIPVEPFTDISARAQAEAAQRRALELAADVGGDDEAPAAETLTRGFPKGNEGHCE
jgi:hypothetical protein